jgi:DNA-binding HxlR family transcriptional regulator
MNNLELDKQIVRAIASGKTRFSEIHNSLGIESRRVDNRLQALRKHFVLRFNSKKGWMLTERADPLLTDEKQ